MKPVFFGKNLKFLREQLGLNQSQMFENVGVKQTTWNGYEMEKSFPKLLDFIKISDFFGVTESELINSDLSIAHLNPNRSITKTGQIAHPNAHANAHLKGNNVLSVAKEEPATYHRMPAVISVDSRDDENVLMVPVRARAGYTNGYADTGFMQGLPAYRLPGLNNGTYRMFEVEGLSMYPTLNSGDVVIGQWVETLDSIRDDRLYVILLKNDLGVVVKRILNRIEKDGKLILKSDNYKDRDQYPAIVVNPQDVAEVWYCTGFLSRQMRPPSEMYNRVVDLEGRLTIMEDDFRKKLQQLT